MSWPDGESAQTPGPTDGKLVVLRNDAVWRNPSSLTNWITVPCVTTSGFGLYPETSPYGVCVGPYFVKPRWISTALDCRALEGAAGAPSVQPADAATANAHNMTMLRFM